MTNTKDALAKVRGPLELIEATLTPQTSSVAKCIVMWVREALQHLTQIEQSLDAAQRPEVETVTVDDLSVLIAEEIHRNVKPVDYTTIGDAPANVIARRYPNGLRIVKVGE